MDSGCDRFSACSMMRAYSSRQFFTGITGLNLSRTGIPIALHLCPASMRSMA